ncbi:MAG: hypothetical protein U5R06_24740 [candidate division KSB1 bacterium]|nr:hypothetical protein [candidate division KSB1 bacterium]
MRGVPEIPGFRRTGNDPGTGGGCRRNSDCPVAARARQLDGRTHAGVSGIDAGRNAPGVQYAIPVAMGWFPNDGFNSGFRLTFNTQKGNRIVQ